MGPRSVSHKKVVLLKKKLSNEYYDINCQCSTKHDPINIANLCTISVAIRISLHLDMSIKNIHYGDPYNQCHPKRFSYSILENIFYF